MAISRRSPGVNFQQGAVVLPATQNRSSTADNFTRLYNMAVREQERQKQAVSDFSKQAIVDRVNLTRSELQGAQIDAFKEYEAFANELYKNTVAKGQDLTYEDRLKLENKKRQLAQQQDVWLRGNKVYEDAISALRADKSGTYNTAASWERIKGTDFRNIADDTQLLVLSDIDLAENASKLRDRIKESTTTSEEKIVNGKVVTTKTDVKDYMNDPAAMDQILRDNYQNDAGVQRTMKNRYAQMLEADPEMALKYTKPDPKNPEGAPIPDYESFYVDQPDVRRSMGAKEVTTTEKLPDWQTKKAGKKPVTPDANGDYTLPEPVTGVTGNFDIYEPDVAGGTKRSDSAGIKGGTITNIVNKTIKGGGTKLYAVVQMPVMKEGLGGSFSWEATDPAKTRTVYVPYEQVEHFMGDLNLVGMNNAKKKAETPPIEKQKEVAASHWKK